MKYVNQEIHRYDPSLGKVSGKSSVLGQARNAALYVMYAACCGWSDKGTMKSVASSSSLRHNLAESSADKVFWAGIASSYLPA